MEVGIIIKCMEEEDMSGQIKDIMMVNIKMIKNKDLVYLVGQMVVNSKGIGKMASSKGRV